MSPVFGDRMVLRRRLLGIPGRVPPDVTADRGAGAPDEVTSPARLPDSGGVPRVVLPRRSRPHAPVTHQPGVGSHDRSHPPHVLGL